MTIRVLTPAGTLVFMAVPVMSGTTMILRGLHVQDSVPNAVGPGNLMVVAQAVMEGMELDGLVIEGALRRLGPIRAIDRVTSGSPAVFVLRIASDSPRLRTIDAIHALARRGMTMLRAKRSVEALLEKGREFVDLPMVEDAQALTADLAATGIIATLIQPDATINVRELRERLQLTREQFSMRYGLEIETLRNWETGKREPDTTARSYLRAIASAPEQLEMAYAGMPPV